MRVRWSEPALTDLREVWLYIAEDSPTRATAMLSRLRLAALRLVQFPRRGRAGVQASTRELVVARTPYIIRYRIEGEEIEILRVLHGAQHRLE